MSLDLSTLDLKKSVQEKRETVDRTEIWSWSSGYGEDERLDIYISKEEHSGNFTLQIYLDRKTDSYAMRMPVLSTSGLRHVDQLDRIADILPAILRSTAEAMRRAGLNDLRSKWKKLDDLREEITESGQWDTYAHRYEQIMGEYRETEVESEDRIAD